LIEFPDGLRFTRPVLSAILSEKLSRYTSGGEMKKKANSCADNRVEEVFTEIVLYENGSALRAHRELFTLPEDAYRPLSEDTIACISAELGNAPDRLHIAAGWETIVRTALWKPNVPGIQEVLFLLDKAGAGRDELKPFSRSDLNDLFPWLYYGKKFDILRRICSMAKAKVEVTSRKFLVYCHLVSEDAGKIVASSL
jgi:hypothetical protein